jgi:hypothetical membrane protein
MVWPSTFTVATHQRTAETASAALPRPPTTGSAPVPADLDRYARHPVYQGNSQGKGKDMNRTADPRITNAKPTPNATPANPATSPAARRLALGAIAGPILFTLAWLPLGLLRPGYSQIRQQISDLGIGPHGILMDGAFVLGGLLILAGVVGIVQATRTDVGTTARWICTVLLALAPLGEIAVGAFNETHVTGHVTGAILAFQTPIIGFLATGLVLRRSPRWRRIGNWLLVASPLTLVLVQIFLQTGPPGAPLAATGLGGLTERIMVGEIQAWYAALGWLAYRRS